jgi:hypothetical protein
MIRAAVWSRVGQDGNQDCQQAESTPGRRMITHPDSPFWRTSRLDEDAGLRDEWGQVEMMLPAGYEVVRRTAGTG